MIENCSSLFTPGILVINPDKKKEWGVGQIQSCINNLITVNFKIPGDKGNFSNLILNLLKKNYCLQNF